MIIFILIIIAICFLIFMKDEKEEYPSLYIPKDWKNMPRR